MQGLYSVCAIYFFALPFLVAASNEQYGNVLVASEVVLDRGEAQTLFRGSGMHRIWLRSKSSSPHITDSILSELRHSVLLKQDTSPVALFFEQNINSPDTLTYIASTYVIGSVRLEMHLPKHNPLHSGSSVVVEQSAAESVGTALSAYETSWLHGHALIESVAFAVVIAASAVFYYKATIINKIKKVP